MIEISVRFWTNDIAGPDGHILPKHCWDSGIIRMPKNDSHGISNQEAKPFNSLMEITQVIEQALIDADIRVSVGSKSSRYISSD